MYFHSFSIWVAVIRGHADRHADEVLKFEEDEDVAKERERWKQQWEMDMIWIKKLRKVFGHKVAADLSFGVPRGEVFGSWE